MSFSPYLVPFATNKVTQKLKQINLHKVALVPFVSLALISCGSNSSAEIKSAATLTQETSYQANPYWENPEVFEENKAPARAHFFAFESKELAELNDKSSSKNFLDLNGQWQFNWVKNPCRTSY